MFNLNLPKSCNWDYKILGCLDKQEIDILKNRTIRIKGDPCELVPVNHNLIEFIFQDFDDFETTIILNKLIGETINIEIARIDSSNNPIIKHSYSTCKIVDSHSFNSKLNCENKTYGKISVKFDWKTRNVIKIQK